MTARSGFQLVAGAVLAVLVVLVVVRPAVERGGWGELGIVVVAFAAILLAERWLRAR